MILFNSSTILSLFYSMIILSHNIIHRHLLKAYRLRHLCQRLGACVVQCEREVGVGECGSSAWIHKRSFHLRSAVGIRPPVMPSELLCDLRSMAEVRPPYSLCSECALAVLWELGGKRLGWGWILLGNRVDSRTKFFEALQGRFLGRKTNRWPMASTLRGCAP